MVGGGLLQLMAYGCMDYMLTPNTEITYWKVNYKRNYNDYDSNNNISCKKKYFNRQFNNFTLLLKPKTDNIKDDYFLKSNIYIANIILNNTNPILQNSKENLSNNFKEIENIEIKQKKKKKQIYQEQKNRASDCKLSNTDLQKEITKKENKSKNYMRQNYSKQVKQSIKIRTR